MIGRSPDVLVKELLDHVVSVNASDLHLSVGRPPIVRIDGKLRVIAEVPPLSTSDLDAIATIILGRERAEEFRSKRVELDVAYTLHHADRFRVNAYYSFGAVAIALRTISANIRTLEELGLPPDLSEFTKASQGFVIIAGPTGHGKTTTMASLVDVINHSRTGHIISIEDPIEYVYQEDQCLIHQREVHGDTPSFAQALKMALREDPNVVVVGEMRDLESISTALTIAETGHLVFTTLHTNDAAQTINRIVDVFPSAQQQQIRVQLSSTLTGIVSQRLLPKKGGGRVPAIELLRATSAVRNLIREGETVQIPGMIQTGASHGMIPLDRSIKSLVDRGLVEASDAAVYLSDSLLAETRSDGVSERGILGE